MNEKLARVRRIAVRCLVNESRTGTFRHCDKVGAAGSIVDMRFVATRIAVTHSEFRSLML